MKILKFITLIAILFNLSLISAMKTKEADKKQFVEVTQKDDEQTYNLKKSIDSRDLEGVKEAIKNGANVNSKNKFGRTPLLEAMVMRSFAIADLLIENKATLDDKNSLGQTALIMAAREGRYELVDKLIKFGANTSVRDCTKKNAYDYAYELYQTSKNAKHCDRGPEGCGTYIFYNLENYAKTVELLS